MYRNAQSTTGRNAGGASSTAPFATMSNTQLAPTQRVERITTKKFEQLQQHRNAAADTHKSLMQYHEHNQLLATNNTSDERVDALRRQKRMASQRAEMHLADKYESEQKESAARELLAEQDAQLSAALSKLRHDQLAEAGHIRRVVESSDEIQQLKAALKAANINSIRANQLEEQKAHRAAEHARSSREDAQIEQMRQRAAELQVDDSQQRLEQAQHARRVLKQQMMEREQAKQQAYTEFLREKSEIDSIVGAIQREDEQQHARQLAKQAELQDNIKSYLVQRKAWREAEKRRAEQELQAIRQYQALQAERQATMQQQKQIKAQAQSDVLQRITAELEAKRREEEEMQQLLAELYAEEAEEKAMEDVRARDAQIIRIRREMMESNAQQKADKARQLQKQAEEEQQFRQEMMAKFAADKQLEAMNAQRRKREMSDHKAAVEQMCLEKKRMYEEAALHELNERQRFAEQQADDLRIIETERQRLLTQLQHDEQAKRHLPKGVLKTQADYEMVYGMKMPSNKFDPAEQVKKHGLQSSILFR